MTDLDAKLLIVYRAQREEWLANHAVTAALLKLEAQSAALVAQRTERQTS